MDKYFGDDEYWKGTVAYKDGRVKICALRYLLTWLMHIDLLNGSFAFPGLTVRHPSSDCCYHILKPSAHRTEFLSCPLKLDVSKGGQSSGLSDPPTCH